MFIFEFSFVEAKVGEIFNALLVDAFHEGFMLVFGILMWIV